MISKYVLEVAEFKSDVKMKKLAVGSCQIHVKLTIEYKKLKIMIGPYVFAIAELKSDDKMTKLTVGSCPLAVKLMKEYKKLNIVAEFLSDFKLQNW